MVLLLEFMAVLTVPTIWRLTIIVTGIVPIIAWLLNYDVPKFAIWMCACFAATMTGLTVHGIQFINAHTYNAGVP